MSVLLTYNFYRLQHVDNLGYCTGMVLHLLWNRRDGLIFTSTHIPYFLPNFEYSCPLYHPLYFIPKSSFLIQIESCFVDMQPFIAMNVCSILTYDNYHIETEDVQPKIKVQKKILQQNCIGHHLRHPLWPKIWVLASLIFENFEYCPLYLNPFYIIIGVLANSL